MNREDALERHVRRLSLPSGRRVGQPGHDVARRYLCDQMEAIGLEPRFGSGFEVCYSAGSQRFVNLVGSVRGANSALPPVLLGAHYDSAIDAPSADDNAAAVAIALEVARALRAAPLQRDGIVALFDAEEPPHYLGPAMGSNRLYEDHLQGGDVACAIIMDLVGHDVEPLNPEFAQLIPDLPKFLFVTGCESNAALPDVVRNAGEKVSGLRVVPTLNHYVGDMSDHHAFRIHGKAFLFLSCGQGRYYHSPQDTPEWLNWKKIGSVCEFVEHLARGLDHADPIPRPSGDTATFEIEMMERATGLSPQDLARALGLPSLKSRADLDSLVARFSRDLLVWGQNGG